jgi:hypothetical protein
VYLEFEDLAPVDETLRHYALPAGNEGLARLPILLQLPEAKGAVDIPQIRKTIENDIFKVPANWTATTN